MMRQMRALLTLFIVIAAGQRPDFNPYRTYNSFWGYPCPFSADPVASVGAALSSSLAGQAAAVRSILEEVQAWADARRDKEPRPLVLMFTGSTGLGKTEAAHAVARGLLGQRGPWGAALPRGLLELSGVRFQDAQNLTRMRDELRGAFAQALFDCQGHVVVVLDEVQKMDKRVLSELLPLLQGARSRLYHADFGGGIKPLDASSMVVVLVSDAGLQVLEGGAAGASARLARKLVDALDMEFLESGLPLGSLVNNIVPFINLNGAEVAAVVAHHLAHERLPRELRDLADALRVEPAALTALSSMAYVPYTSWLTTWEPEKNQTEPQRMHTDACQKDARRVERERQQQQQREAAVGADGGASAAAPEAAGPTLCGAPCGVPASCVAMRGARSVMHQAATPVKRLTKLLGRFGAAGALLRARPSPEELRHALKASAAAELPVGQLPTLRVELRVSAACSLPGVRTAGMCTAAGLPGAGLRVQRCEVMSGCPACSSELLRDSEKCETLFEGELPA